MYRAHGQRIGEDELLLVVPLTLGLNQLNRMHWRRKHRYRGQQGTAVMACLRQIFGARIPKPWAQRVRLRACRCTDAHVTLDPINAIGGMKQTEDGIVSSGLIPDDNDRHVVWDTMVEQRTAGKWGEFDGPATYVWIRRLA